MTKIETKKKKILRASWRERLYFLLHGRIPNYAMRANNDISLAWLNILNDPKSEIRYFREMPDDEKKVIRRFLCTNRISNRKEQGSAVWLPSDVKKRLDDFRATAKRNIPIRTLVSAIVVAFLDENEGKLKEL